MILSSDPCSGSAAEWTPEFFCTPTMSHQLLESVLLIKEYEKISALDIGQKGPSL